MVRSPVNPLIPESGGRRAQKHIIDRAHYLTNTSDGDATPKYNHSTCVRTSIKSLVVHDELHLVEAGVWRQLLHPDEESSYSDAVVPLKDCAMRRNVLTVTRRGTDVLEAKAS